MLKKYIRIRNSHLVGLLAISAYILYTNNQKLKEETSTLISNQKAFIAENSSLKEENRVFKFTVEQLNYYNDYILEKMNEVMKELKIKDFNNTEVFPAENATEVQFDTYSEAKSYVDEHNLIYEEPEYGE